MRFHEDTGAGIGMDGGIPGVTPDLPLGEGGDIKGQTESNMEPQGGTD